MAQREPFAVDEWYHCYNRGVEKRNVFENEYDANRFLMTLFLANGEKSVKLFQNRKPHIDTAFAVERGNPIAAIGAYCLMPNHFHLLIKEIVEGGISSFMQKLGTAYTMYFNAKYERVGGLFLKPFRARHIRNDRYFQRVVEYIHCNPAELYEPGWKRGNVQNIKTLEKKLVDYPYSSLQSYTEKQVINPILSREVFDIANQAPLSRMLEESRVYYGDLSKDHFEA